MRQTNIIPPEGIDLVNKHFNTTFRDSNPKDYALLTQYQAYATGKISGFGDTSFYELLYKLGEFLAESKPGA